MQPEKNQPDTTMPLINWQELELERRNQAQTTKIPGKRAKTCLSKAMPVNKQSTCVYQ